MSGAAFECPDLPDFHPKIVMEPWSIQQGDTVIQLPQRTPFDTTVNRHPQFPTDSLVDSAQDHLTDHDQLSLNSSRTDSSDSSLHMSLPELPIEMEPVQLMNQFLTQLTTKPSTEINPTPSTGTAANNILDWLKNFDHIACNTLCLECSKAVASYTCLSKGHSPEFLSLITRANKN